MVRFEGLGVNVVIKHPTREGIDAYVRHIQSLGMDWVRLELNFFNPLEDWLNDALIDKLVAADIRILGVLTGLVPGNLVNVLLPRLRFPRPRLVLDEYVAFCETMASRYHGRIRHWEIWNEENTLRFWIERPDPAAYVEMVRSASEALRRLDPANRIVMGAIMGDDIRKLAPFQRMGFLRTCLDLGIDRYIDVYNFHPYIPACYFGRQEEAFFERAIPETIEGFLGKHQDLGKPVWITEFGVCPLWVKVDQAAIGRIYAKMYRYAKARGIPFFLWVLTDFRGPEYSRFNPETAFGLLDWELREKEVCRSLAEALSPPR